MFLKYSLLLLFVHCITGASLSINNLYFLSTPQVNNLPNNQAQYYGRMKIYQTPVDNFPFENLYFSQYVVDLNTTVAQTILSPDFLSFFSILTKPGPQNSIHSIQINSSFLEPINDYCIFATRLRYSNIVALTPNATNAIITTSKDGELTFYSIDLSRAYHRPVDTVCNSTFLGFVNIGKNYPSSSVFGTILFPYSYNVIDTVNGTNETEVVSTVLQIMATVDGMYLTDLTNFTFKFVPISGIVSMSSNIGYNDIVYLLGTFPYENTSAPAVASFDIFSGNLTFMFTVSSLGLLQTDKINGYFILAQPSLNALSILDNSGRIIGSSYQTCDTWQSFIYMEGSPMVYCPNNCKSTAQGVCVHGSCQCLDSWTLSDCSGCDSGSFCNDHGICQPYDVRCFKNFLSPPPNRTCQCITAWEGPRCSICDPDIMCSGKGTCDSGSCQCFDGYSGTNCSTCNSDIVCSANGNCDNGTCVCREYWTGENCANFQFANKGLRDFVFIANCIALGLLFIAVLVASSAVIVQNLSVGESMMKYISLPAVHAIINHFQSFAAVITNNIQLIKICNSQFHLFFLVNVDFVSTFGWIENIIWTESVTFLPKVILFVIWLLLFKMVKNARFRGICLQFGLWFFFSLLLSLFGKYQGNSCKGCSKVYNILTEVLSFLMIAILLYLAYRLWKVIIENKLNLEIVNRDYDTFVSYSTSSSIRSASSTVNFLYRLLALIFYPWSEIFSNVFKGLSGVSENRQEVNQRQPPLSVTASKKSKKHEYDLTVEEFLNKIMVKMNMQEHEVDISKIVAMLKGNWYTTVADLRTLTAPDAEKLKIPLRLYRAMQDELPKEEKPEAYTALDSLVKTTQTMTFLKTFSCMTDDYSLNYVLFRLDNLLTRNVVWAALVVSLWQHPVAQLSTLTIFQLWYCGFLIWHKPHKQRSSFIAELVVELGMLIILSCFLYMVYFKSMYILLAVVSGINIVIVLFATLFHFFYTCISKIQSSSEEDRVPLIRDKVDQDFRNTKKRINT